jgi:hypothetical protein
MRIDSASSSTPTQRPKPAELRRKSTATSKILPAITRISLPCGWRIW